MARLVFLGTGASGGTPGEGRSRRRESSLLAEADRALLLDVTRDFPEQAELIDRLDAVLLTHAHADASGGLARLRAWWREREADPLPLYAAPAALGVIEDRFARRDHLRPEPVEPGEAGSEGPWSFRPVEVPHAREERFVTYAWRLDGPGGSLVYASDVARLTSELEEACRGADLLVLDGATWGRRIYTHLRIDEDLPVACRFEVDRILLTQIGRSAPPHPELARRVAELCPKAAPAYDGLAVSL